VFKALELGALDFVAKPDRRTDSELAGIREELLEKVLLVQTLRPAAFAARRRFDSMPKLDLKRSDPPGARPERVIAMASSTGGPTALMEIFSRLPRRPRSAILIAQHMPDKFTRTFAERLDRRSTMAVSEAQDGVAVTQRTALVCPGRRCMELVDDGGDLRVRIGSPDPEDRYVPSADRLFRSVAAIEGANAVGIILTGMGDDGVEGARAILEAGGTIIAESEETAVVYGMPGTAVRAGVVTRTLNLTEIADWITTFG
jgi:two-component system chemotaxis response regulator CheB